MREDLERVRRRQRERDAGAPGGAAARPAGADFRGGGDAARGAGAGAGAGAGLKEAVDKLLIADFFFVIFALAWFAAGLAQQAGGQSTVRFFF
jgi:hypothetical protein